MKQKIIKNGGAIRSPLLALLVWIDFSKWMKKKFGCYPPREMLVELAKMDKGERKEHLWFGLYLWETRRNK